MSQFVIATLRNSGWTHVLAASAPAKPYILKNGELEALYFKRGEPTIINTLKSTGNNNLLSETHGKHPLSVYIKRNEL